MTPEEKERLLKKAQEAKARKLSQQKTSSRSKTKEELEKELAEGKANIKKTKTLPDGTVEITTKDGKKIYARGKLGQKEDLSKIVRKKVTKLTTDPEKYGRDICARIKREGASLDRAVAEGWISESQKANFANCVDASKVKTDESEFFELEEEPVDKTTITKKDEIPVDDKTITEEKKKEEKKKEGELSEIKRQGIDYKTVQQDVPWWLQDIVGVAGAFGDLNRINRYPPWQATPDVYLPEATFYDPNRELAANAEQANIQTQGLAAFTGPQALSARSAQIQGQALKNAADVMGRYNNLNVGLANQLEQQRVGILNNAAQNQANLDTQLWDKYTIMNQQFDNSKAQARQELRKQYINAITNRAKTQALNTLYPNFKVLPETGGYVLPTDLSYTPTYTGQSDGSVEKQLWKQASEIDPANTFNIWRELMRTKYNNKSSQYPYQGYEGES